MNRRKFFGLTAATVTALGLPEIVLPERKIFLPPTQGWYPSLRMREVCAYMIKVDEYVIIHDAVGFNRVTGQYEVFSTRMSVNHDAIPPYACSTELGWLSKQAEHVRESARRAIALKFEARGLKPIAPIAEGSAFQLRIPKIDGHAVYC